MADAPNRLPITWTFCVFGVLFIVYKILQFGRREKGLPPGPPTIPILGNAHLLAGDNLHHKIKKWGDEYGSIFSLKVGRGTTIVLNSRRAIHEILDKRSAIYSDRPSDQQVRDTFRNENLVFQDANPVWKEQRKLAVQYLTPTKLDDGDIAKIFEAEIGALMHDLLNGPDNFRNLVKRCTASAAAIVVYGHRDPSIDGFWSTAVYRSTDFTDPALTPGSYPPTEQFPILKLIPNRWNPARTRALDAYTNSSAIWLDACERVEQRRSNGDRRDSLLDKILDEDLKLQIPMGRQMFANFFGTIMAAAADTTAVSVLTNIRYLAKNPKIQEKARVELDAICGVERMPTWKDFAAAPYINCIIKEGLRINPVVKTGLPHKAKRDDWYEGMFIPAGSSILISAWALGRSHYEDSENYNPDRYLNHPRLAMAYAGSADYNNRDHYGYGTGRRICAGIHVAERTQWRILSKLLWGFYIEQVVDEETGKKVDLDTDAYGEGLAPEPTPYRVKMTPRSEKHAEVIRREFADVNAFLKRWE